MATINTPALHIINAATKNELKLVKAGGFYHVGTEVIVGDLYRDPIDLHVAILVVLRKVVLEELTVPAMTPPVPPAPAALL